MFGRNAVNAISGVEGDVKQTTLGHSSGSVFNGAPYVASVMQHAPGIDEIPLAQGLDEAVIQNVAATNCPCGRISLPFADQICCRHGIRIVVEAEYTVSACRECGRGMDAAAAADIEEIQSFQVVALEEIQNMFPRGLNPLLIQIAPHETGPVPAEL